MTTTTYSCRPTPDSEEDEPLPTWSSSARRIRHRGWHKKDTIGFDVANNGRHGSRKNAHELRNEPNPCAPCLLEHSRKAPEWAREVAPLAQGKP